MEYVYLQLVAYLYVLLIISIVYVIHRFYKYWKVRHRNKAKEIEDMIEENYFNKFINKDNDKKTK